MASAPNTAAEDQDPVLPEATLRQDLMTLTKFRLSMLVLLTTIAGYLAGADLRPDWMLASHTMFGTALCAFGASVFNQLMEIEADRRMSRTRNRPLPARRLPAGAAFAIGCAISAIGVLHLARFVRPHDPQAAYMAGLTLLVYVLVYTPMKRRSSLNTVVGAVAGAIPPVIGWLAAGRGYDTGAAILFAILFFWQLPHFVAINWMYREEYEQAGFVMWSNHDHNGRLSSWLCLVFSLCLLAASVWPHLAGLAHWGHAVASTLCGGWLVWLSWCFVRDRHRPAARKVFLFTLLFLPLALGSLLVFWNR